MSDIFEWHYCKLYMYYDIYLGGEKFAGEEAVWKHGEPVWSMNYVGRVIGEHFSGDFLKEALSRVPMEKPFRGPDIRMLFSRRGDSGMRDVK